MAPTTTDHKETLPAAAAAQDGSTVAVWETSGAEKRASVQSMFAEIAPTYDRLNGLLSLNFHRKWRGIAVKGLRLTNGGSVADICCGSGDFMTEIRSVVGATGTVVGVDFCLPMLQQADAKRIPGIHLGDALSLPLQSGKFDAATVGWGLRNVPDIDVAHAEIFRVLRSGGRFASIDMAKPRNPMTRAISKFFFNTFSPLLGKLFGCPTAYTYLPESTERFASREDLIASMQRAGFTDCTFKDLMFGNICIHWGTKP